MQTIQVPQPDQHLEVFYSTATVADIRLKARSFMQATRPSPCFHLKRFGNGSD